MYQYEDPDGAGTEPKALSFIMHPKGRILDDGSGYTYQYFLKDHLGNTRVLFGDLDGDGKINPDPAIAQDVDQVVDYYPFGLAMSASQAPVGTPAQNYTYNGKELQDELGLGWLDYGARMYDPSIGRWNGVDALAEKYAAWSPFNYVMGNPLRFVDPDGMRVQDSVKMKPAHEGGGAVDAGTTETVEIVAKRYQTIDAFERRAEAYKKLEEMGMPTNKPMPRRVPLSLEGGNGYLLTEKANMVVETGADMFIDKLAGNILEATTRVLSSVSTPIWYGINDYDGLMSQTNSGRSLWIPYKYQIDFRYNITHLGNLRFEFTKVDSWGHNTPTIQQASNAIDGAISIGSFGYKITPVSSILDGPVESFIRKQAVNIAVKTPISQAPKIAVKSLANSSE
jgi:RHS repeat-associated protein